MEFHKPIKLEIDVLMILRPFDDKMRSKAAIAVNFKGSYLLRNLIHRICKVRVFVQVRHLDLCASVNVGAATTAF